MFMWTNQRAEETDNWANPENNKKRNSKVILEREPGINTATIGIYYYHHH